MRVIDKVRHAQRTSSCADFQYLKSQVSAGRMPKVTIPSPTMLHFRGGRAGISQEAYPELDRCSMTTSPMPTATNCVPSRRPAAPTCNGRHQPGLSVRRKDARSGARQRGDDPNELPHRYAKFINKVVAQKPAGMMLAMHLCRGNFKSTHAASGDYEPVAEALLKEMNLDAYFMEYDDDRIGRLQAAALPAQRQDGGAGPGHDEVRAAREQG